MSASPAASAARSATLSATIEVEVMFHDLDPANIVWHGHYARFLAQARDTLMARLGYSHAEMADSGILWPVTEMKLRYLQPARLGQRLRVTATIVEHEERLKIAYEIRDAAGGRRLTRASTVQVPVKMPEGQLLYTAPAALRARLDAAIAAADAQARR
ncbi:MAG: acyl-CoA thioesterase [Burkholderiaceae bacterium]|jgi:acyl-CoA thioester hydrolase|nr:acyl-CoA thioesterase [Burkholderiaceae bacterium]